MTDQMREYITKQAAWLLRTVAEGGSTGSKEFWTITLAIEAVVDGNEAMAELYYRQLQQFEIAGILKARV